MVSLQAGTLDPLGPLGPPDPPDPPEPLAAGPGAAQADNKAHNTAPAASLGEAGALARLHAAHIELAQTEVAHIKVARIKLEHNKLKRIN